MSEVKDVISKELLSEVLEDRIKAHDIGFVSVNESAIGRDGMVHINYKNRNGFIKGFFINIHELAYKCKEWGLSEFKDCLFSINEFSSFDNVRIEVVKYTDNKVEEKKFNFKLSRPENMIECCQWILENNKDK